MKINMIDIGESNDIRIQEIVETPVPSGDPIREPHSRVVDSRMDLSGEDPIIQAIAADLPYDDAVPVDGARVKIKRIRINPATGIMAITRASEVVENGEVVASQSLPSTIIDMVDDVDADPKVIAMKARHHTPERVQAERDRREAAKPKPEPEYEMVDKPFSRVERVDGKPTLVTGVEQVPKTRKVRVVNEDDSPAFDEKGKPLFANEKVLKGG